jgi:gamma-glutamyl:cysteine ligase YbdK (ATP-grasp superfamily)
MGKEITRSHFHKRDFSAFEARLREETRLLREWFERGVFSGMHDIGGFEVECWLTDPEGFPAPINERFLEIVDSPLVVPELARFNVEINTPPQRLEGGALHQMHANFDRLWQRCEEVAAKLGARMVMTGILPTVGEHALSLDNISDRTRYRALNEQVLRMRKGSPIELDIPGRQPLHTYHTDVMLESATTSFQIHLQVAPGQDARFYNAAVILSAPMVAVCANSPYLFGHELWDETRIPLFEQAVSICPPGAEACPAVRVGFGKHYLRQSLAELFLENLEEHPVLMPELSDEAPANLFHLRLHNGTIWRWNRPLIGFDDDSTPHLRIEHRVVPAGPSVIDTIANAALFYGLVQSLATDAQAPESRLPFDRAHANFYAAARDGLRARLVWLDGRESTARDLVLQELLPVACRGLESLGIAVEDIGLYLGVIEARVRRGRNGAEWQRRYVEKYGTDMRALVKAYAEHQRSGAPVHEWEI